MQVADRISCHFTFLDGVLDWETLLCFVEGCLCSVYSCVVLCFAVFVSLCVVLCCVVLCGRLSLAVSGALGSKKLPPPLLPCHPGAHSFCWSEAPALPIWRNPWSKTPLTGRRTGALGWKMCRQLIARCTQLCQHLQHWQHSGNSGNTANTLPTLSTLPTLATQWQGLAETLLQICHIGSNFPSLRLIAQLTLHFFQFPFSFLFMTGNSLVSAADDQSPSSSQASFSFLFRNSFSAPSSFSYSSFHDVPKPKPAYRW